LCGDLYLLHREKKDKDREHEGPVKAERKRVGAK
jgi:hypothetical protein